MEASTLPSRDWVRDGNDARRYLRLTTAYALTIYAVLALALAGRVPAWVLIVVVPIVYVRLALALHELMHIRPASTVPAFHRLTLLMESPLGLGYREHRAIHFAHHRFFGTERDPELYQIVGGPLQAFIAAVISPERHAVIWIRTHGLTRAFVAEHVLRLAAFIVALLWNPQVFLVYWVTLRLSIGTAAFVFHHVLHNREGRLGTYPLPASTGVVTVARWLLGRESMLILGEHERHHRWPRVRATDLPRLPDPTTIAAEPVASRVAAAGG